jgi:hypothetical protein
MVHNARRPQDEDREPWYRQFWPWFLIALPASVVVAGLTTLVIANRYSDDLVVSDYYKDGLAINRQLDKQARARDLGLAAEVLVLERRIQVRLGSGGNGEVSGPYEVELRLSHPLEADRDFAVTLRRSAPGLYVGELPATVARNWHWTLVAGDDSWRLDGSLGPTAFLDEPVLPGAESP